MKSFFILVLFCSVIHLNVSAQQKIRLSDDLYLVKLSDNTYMHTSFANTAEFGRFPSNGLVFISSQKAFLFDTPIDESVTKLLLSWIADSMKLKLEAFVPNHYHTDCMGQLELIKSLGVPSYANQLTVDFAERLKLPVPEHAFKDSLVLNSGSAAMYCYYFGGGHTADNIVVYIPSEKILFGGCMVKSMSSVNMGNTADAVMSEWPSTIESVYAKFKDARFVIPGHGDFGGPELLVHTRDLLKE